MKKIILASNSPRRRDILTKMGLSFKIIPSNYEEVLTNFHFTYDKINKLAENKALEVASRVNYPALILGADTVVVLDNYILLKPSNKQDAIDKLKVLSNKEHFVVTSLCVVDTESKKVITQPTTSYIRFKKLSETMIVDYVENFKPFDKAGAYGIQELSDGFVEYIKGDIENIIGLSSNAVKDILEKINK